MIDRLCFKYLITIAIALSLHPAVKAQTETDTSLDNIRGRLASEWENPVLTHSLESATEIEAIEFSPNGQLLASVGAGQITLWDLDSKEIQRVLPGHYASEIKMEIAPTAIAFSPDSRFIATSTWSQGLLNPDRSILVRDVSTGEEVFSISDRAGCRQVVFDPSGKVLYGACESGVTAWNFPDGEELFSFDTEYPVEAIALSYQNGNKVMATVDANVSGEDRGDRYQIQLWQLGDERPKLLNTLDGHTRDIVGLEFTADGQKLVSSSYNGKIDVWNWQQGTTYRNTNNLYSKNGVFGLDANGKTIAGNFPSSTMANLVTGLPLRNVVKLPSREGTNAIAFSPQERLFATVSNRVASNSIVNLWSADNSQSEKQSEGTNNYRAIPITKHWINQEKSPTPAFEPELNKPSAIGRDPQAIALAALGLTETVESQQEEVELEYPNENLATVTITQANLADDSVAGVRYLVKFAPYGDRAGEKWQAVWAGEQFKCRSGRGHRDWGADLCQ